MGGEDGVGGEQGDGGAYQRGENVAVRESIAFWKIKSCILHPPLQQRVADRPCVSSAPLLLFLLGLLFTFAEETQTSAEDAASALP